MDEEQLAGIADELGSLCERLDELAYAALRDAVGAGETKRPEIEKKIVRARNAIERARHLLISS